MGEKSGSLVRQKFLSYYTKNTIHKAHMGKLDLSELKISNHQNVPIREKNDKAQIGRECLKVTYLIKDLEYKRILQLN